MNRRKAPKNTVTFDDLLEAHEILLAKRKPTMPRRIAVIGLKSTFLALSILGVPYLVFWALNALQVFGVGYRAETVLAFWIIMLVYKAFLR